MPLINDINSEDTQLWKRKQELGGLLPLAGGRVRRKISHQSHLILLRRHWKMKKDHWIQRGRAE